MATPITGPSRVSVPLATRQAAETSPAQPPNAPALAATPHVSAAHSKATFQDCAHAGTPTAGVPRASLTSSAATAASRPQFESARFYAAKRALDAAGFSGNDAQAFFDSAVVRLLDEDPQKLESWLAGVILAASHTQAAPSAPVAGTPQTLEDPIALLTQQPHATHEQRVTLATLAALPDVELQRRLAGTPGSPSRPAA